MRYLGLVLYCLLLLSGPAVGQSAQIGDAKGLDMLKRMQGRWNIACQNSGHGSGAYRTLLAVSFTHFNFETREYYDSDCFRLRASRQAKYRFVLGDSQIAQDGSQAFAINFQQESSDAGGFYLTPANLIRVHQGRLFLGLPGNQDTQTQPEALDYTRPFVR